MSDSLTILYRCQSSAYLTQSDMNFEKVLTLKAAPDKSCEDLFVKLVLHIRHSIPAIFFPRYILYTFFSFLLIYGGLGFGDLGLGFWIGFLGLVFSVDQVLGLWCRAFYVFWGWGSLYKHRRITPGQKLCFNPCSICKTWCLSCVHE